MSIERLISRNLDRQTAKSRAARHVALIGTTLSFAIMVIAIATQGGFSQTIEHRIQILLADAHLVPRESWIGSNSTIEYDEEFSMAAQQTKGIDGVDAILDLPMVAHSPTGAVNGVLMHGVDPLTTTGIHELITQGSPNALQEEKTIIISKTLAQNLGRQVGQTIDIIALDEQMPRKTTLTIGAIYSSAMGELEGPMVFCSIDYLRHFAGLDSTSITAYEIRGGGVATEEFDELAAEYSLSVVTTQDRAREFFDWLAMLQANVLLVLIIMLAVALINVTSSALIIILESTQKIALLSALGVRKRSLQRIFLRRTMWIVTQGALYGVAIGVVIVALENWLHIVKLNPDNYFVEWLPMHFATIEITSVVAIVFGVVALTVWAATHTVSRIEIASGLKFE